MVIKMGVMEDMEKRVDKVLNGEMSLGEYFARSQEFNVRCEALGKKMQKIMDQMYGVGILAGDDNENL